MIRQRNKNNLTRMTLYSLSNISASSYHERTNKKCSFAEVWWKKIGRIGRSEVLPAADENLEYSSLNVAKFKSIDQTYQKKKNSSGPDTQLLQHHKHNQRTNNKKDETTSHWHEFFLSFTATADRYDFHDDLPRRGCQSNDVSGR